MQLTLNQRVKKARELLNFSQEYVAEAINKKHTAISKIENGAQDVPNTLITFYDSKGVSLEWLLYEKGEILKTDTLEEAKSKTSGFSNMGNSTNKFRIGATTTNDTSKEGVNSIEVQFWKEQYEELKKEYRELKALYSELDKEYKELLKNLANK